jgi:hypothetical protein
MDKKFTKLSVLVNDSFTVEKSYGWKFKKWDPESKKMLVSERYEQGFQKRYTLETDKGILDLGSGQLSSLLEAVYKDGAANIIGRTFNVKSNGKVGMDIRYFFNAEKETKERPLPQKQWDATRGVDDLEPVTDADLADIPF